MAAMAGSIAEAYYGQIPHDLLSYAKGKLTAEALELCEEFYKGIKIRGTK